MIKYGYKGLNKIRSRIHSEELKEKWRKSITDFTRKRKMDFERLIHYILNKKGLSTNMEIYNFFDKINEETDMSAQALLDQRLKLKPEIFVDLNEDYLKGFYSEYRETDVKNYKGYILKAIDGTDFEIPNTEKSKDTFGRVKTKSGESIPRTSVSMCYDVLNGYIIDVIPEKYRSNEIYMAKQHMKKDQEITEDYESIYIMDRNYVSLDFISFLQKNGINFLARLNLGYYVKETTNMKTKDEIIKIERTKERMKRKYFENEETREYAKKNKIEVRILKYVLKTGDIESFHLFLKLFI